MISLLVPLVKEMTDFDFCYLPFDDSHEKVVKTLSICHCHTK